MHQYGLQKGEGGGEEGVFTFQTSSTVYCVCIYKLVLALPSSLLLLFIVAINLIVQHIKDILAGNVKTKPERKRRARKQSDSLLARPH